MMSVRTEVLLLFLGMALVTYLPRMLPIVLLSRFRMPPLLQKWLEFIPAAVLSALLAQGLLLDGGKLALPPDNLALLAAIPAFAVAIRTRSLMSTVVAGIAAMALLRAFL